MRKSAPKSKRRAPAKTQTVDLSQHVNWPRRVPKDDWWQKLAAAVREQWPGGLQQAWGIPFNIAQGVAQRAVLVSRGKPQVTIAINAQAAFLCFLHNWHQIPSTIRSETPAEGLVVAEYELAYADGTRHSQPVRGRFEVSMAESPGPPWLAVEFNMPTTVDPARPASDMMWGMAQYGLYMGHLLVHMHPPLLVYAMPNPFPAKRIRALTLRGLQQSPLLIAAVTLYQGSSNPLRHLPRRVYRVKTAGKPRRVAQAEVDFGSVARIERTIGARGKAWLEAPYTGVNHPWAREAREPERAAEDLIEAYGAEEATLSVTLEGSRKPLSFSLGAAFETGRSASGEASLEVLGKRRQWMQVTIIDASTGRPTPARIHFSGPRGEYLAPYGHHSQINPNWFEDYGADVLVNGRSFAYVSGEFTTDLPVGEVYVEIFKGFEYRPLRRKVAIKPADKTLTLKVERWKDLRSQGWVTADTHVHFVSPHTAWLEAQAEGVNVVNLLASQWGRLFTNVGDYTGRVGIVENDTIVYVGTENRNHMLGHMSMLGTQGLPVYPMCCGGPSESWVADPDFLTMAEWALENRRKGGIVIRPHFPHCGFTEDPVPILKGLVDALEIGGMRGQDFQAQEWYRYLNCGYRVAVVGGTDKMGAYAPIGWLRTYARLDPSRPFTYQGWANAVRAGRTVSTTGPIIDLFVEGQGIGDTIGLPATGGTLEIHAFAESHLPLGTLEVVHNGRVVACHDASTGVRKLEIRDRIRISDSGWIAARCAGYPDHPGSYQVAHTSPVYVNCGDHRPFDAPAAQHMLALVEGGIEYLLNLATVFDETARKRMVKVFNEARRELKGRLVVEGGHRQHHGAGQYHVHGPGEASHRHR